MVFCWPRVESDINSSVELVPNVIDPMILMIICKTITQNQMQAMYLYKEF